MVDQCMFVRSVQETPQNPNTVANMATVQSRLVEDTNGMIGQQRIRGHRKRWVGGASSGKSSRSSSHSNRDSSALENCSTSDNVNSAPGFRRVSGSVSDHRATDQGNGEISLFVGSAAN
eukprot:475167_1